MDIGRRLMGYRFLPPKVAEKYDLDLPEYHGIDQILELSTAGTKGEEKM